VRPVIFEPVTPQERVQQLIAAGTPEFFAKLLVSSQIAIAQGKMGTPSTAVKELTGLEPMSVREFLSAHRAALMPSAQTAGH
jgi:NAD(P)H dehydrogenase (quinone)